MVHKSAIVTLIQDGYFQLVKMRKKASGLTEKEQGVLELLHTGMLYKEIAVRKSISIDTVKKHCKNIYRKLGVRNRVEAIFHNVKHHHK